MNGIGYDAKAVLYNRTGGSIGKPVTWYGTELTNVRVELTQARNMAVTGQQEANICTVKVHDADLPKPYVPAAKWLSLEDKTDKLTFNPEKDYIMITYKPDLGIDVEAPIGVIADSDYQGGLAEYLTEHYGMVYMVKTADHYSLIPHWQIGGR